MIVPISINILFALISIVPAKTYRDGTIVNNNPTPEIILRTDFDFIYIQPFIGLSLKVRTRYNV
jgi:predicted nucleic acid-binding protein